MFDHVGRSTFGISTFVADRGGIVVTCGSSTGYQHVFDNRYLWMKLKRTIGLGVTDRALRARIGEEQILPLAGPGLVAGR